MYAFLSKCMMPFLDTSINLNVIKHYTDHIPGDDCHFVLFLESLIYGPYKAGFREMKNNCFKK